MEEVSVWLPRGGDWFPQKIYQTLSSPPKNYSPHACPPKDEEEPMFAGTSGPKWDICQRPWCGHVFDGGASNRCQRCNQRRLPGEVAGLTTFEVRGPIFLGVHLGRRVTITKGDNGLHRCTIEAGEGHPKEEYKRMKAIPHAEIDDMEVKDAVLISLDKTHVVFSNDSGEIRRLPSSKFKLSTKGRETALDRVGGDRNKLADFWGIQPTTFPTLTTDQMQVLNNPLSDGWMTPSNNTFFNRQHDGLAGQEGDDDADSVYSVIDDDSSFEEEEDLQEEAAGLAASLQDTPAPPPEPVQDLAASLQNTPTPPPEPTQDLAASLQDAPAPPLEPTQDLAASLQAAPEPPPEPDNNIGFDDIYPLTTEEDLKRMYEIISKVETNYKLEPGRLKAFVIPPTHWTEEGEMFWESRMNGIAGRMRVDLEHTASRYISEKDKDAALARAKRKAKATKRPPPEPLEPSRKSKRLDGQQKNYDERHRNRVRDEEEEEGEEEEEEEEGEEEEEEEESLEAYVVSEPDDEEEEERGKPGPSNARKKPKAAAAPKKKRDGQSGAGQGRKRGPTASAAMMAVPTLPINIPNVPEDAQRNEERRLMSSYPWGSQRVTDSRGKLFTRNEHIPQKLKDLLQHVVEGELYQGGMMKKAPGHRRFKYVSLTSPGTTLPSVKSKNKKQGVAPYGFQVQYYFRNPFKLTRVATVQDTEVGAYLLAACFMDPRLVFNHDYTLRFFVSATAWMEWISDPGVDLATREARVDQWRSDPTVAANLTRDLRDITAANASRPSIFDVVLPSSEPLTDTLPMPLVDTETLSASDKEHLEAAFPSFDPNFQLDAQPLQQQAEIYPSFPLGAGTSIPESLSANAGSSFFDRIDDQPLPHRTDGVHGVGLPESLSENAGSSFFDRIDDQPNGVGGESQDVLSFLDKDSLESFFG
jgi:hypothetical protein